MGLSEVIFDLWEAKSALWEASSRVWRPRSETQDPDFDLKEAKICGPRAYFPSGERILTSGEVKTRSIWPIFGSRGPKMANFWDPSLEKVAELWPRRGSVLHFWTPKDPQILKVHKMRHPKETSNVGLKNFVFHKSQVKIPI